MRERNKQTWTGLVLTAFVGSAIYGGSLAYALGHTDASILSSPWKAQGMIAHGALWMVAAAGLSWCVFGPLLVAVTRKGVAACAFACLVTMACGISVLMAAAVVNLAAAGSTWFSAAPFNAFMVGASNVVMAIVLARRLGSIGVPWWKTAIVWISGLDGAGAILFWTFRVLLEGGR